MFVSFHYDVLVLQMENQYDNPALSDDAPVDKCDISLGLNKHAAVTYHSTKYVSTGMYRAKKPLLETL